MAEKGGGEVTLGYCVKIGFVCSVCACQGVQKTDVKTNARTGNPMIAPFDNSHDSEGRNVQFKVQKQADVLIPVSRDLFASTIFPRGQVVVLPERDSILIYLDNILSEMSYDGIQRRVDSVHPMVGISYIRPSGNGNYCIGNNYEASLWSGQKQALLSRVAILGSSGVCSGFPGATNEMFVLGPANGVGDFFLRDWGGDTVRVIPGKKDVIAWSAGGRVVTYACRLGPLVACEIASDTFCHRVLEAITDTEKVYVSVKSQADGSVVGAYGWGREVSVVEVTAGQSLRIRRLACRTPIRDICWVDDHVLVALCEDGNLEVVDCAGGSLITCPISCERLLESFIVCNGLGVFCIYGGLDLDNDRAIVYKTAVIK